MNTNSQKGYASFKGMVIIVCSIVLVLVSLLAYRSASQQVRDAQRVTDITQIQTALKAYKEANLSYPETAFGSQPKNLNQYLEFWPKAPRPADGRCSDEANEYEYNQLDGGESYTLNFCLGSDINGWQAGQYSLKP